MAISQFKAQCLAVVDRVGRTGQPLLITKRGKPIAQIVPPPLAETPRKSAAGYMKGHMEIVGDIMEPLGVVWSAEYE